MHTFARALDSACALRQGVNMTALREIKLLRELHSPYIVRLLDIFPHKRNLSLVRSRAPRTSAQHTRALW